jgi:L-idonate 5-dehydrogenase
VVADGIPLAQAALAEPCPVGLHAVVRAGSLLGKRVLVSGCGPIGALAVRQINERRVDLAPAITRAFR